MKTIQGPALFLAQFAGDTAPFNTLKNIAGWAKSLGYKGVQIPAWDARLFDLKRAAESKAYCDEILGILASNGLELTELSTHLQGQLVAVHPAYDLMFDGFAAEHVRKNPKARQAWAVEQMMFAARASANLGLKAHATFSGALAWPAIGDRSALRPGPVAVIFQGPSLLPSLTVLENVALPLQLAGQAQHAALDAARCAFTPPPSHHPTESLAALPIPRGPRKSERTH